MSHPLSLCYNTPEVLRSVICHRSTLYVVLRKFYPSPIRAHVKSLRFSLVPNCDSGFVEIGLRRSPRIKQLSLSRTNSGSFYSVSQPKSRSVQRVHSFQHKSGNLLAHHLQKTAYFAGSVFGKRNLKFDIFFLDT